MREGGGIMEIVELKKGIYWVGAIDWNVRDFHGYSTPTGTTYNAYLILDEKNVLVDTVKTSFYLEMLGRISEIIDPSKIDVIVSNHVEMDHSSSLPNWWKGLETRPSLLLKEAEGFRETL